MWKQSLPRGDASQDRHLSMIGRQTGRQAGYRPASRRAMPEYEIRWAGGLQAEKKADVIIWDGGNNDMPFFKPGVLTHP